MSDAQSAGRAEYLAAIGRGLTELHTKFYGQSPTKTRTYILNDTVVCLLEGGFTTVERTLIDDGNVEAVHEIRRSFQTTMERPFKEVVEGATHRKVIAYMSQIHTNPDIAVELFVLEPQETEVSAEHQEEVLRPPVGEPD
jgi:uncharacterized protein YbcI